MGKRKGGLTGLSRFLESFKSDTTLQTTAAQIPDPPTSAPANPSISGESEKQPENRPTKRRKMSQKDNVEFGQYEGASGVNLSVDKYYATGLVPHYSRVSQVPDDLKKYFSQRTRFFSLYSTPPGCLLDEEGWYSVTPELVADQIAERCRCDTILDAFCGVGGNAIAFAKTCQRVIALDISPTRLALARHNAQIYGVADRIEFVLADYISFAKSYLSLTSDSHSSTVPATRKIDVVFLSPPWGGPSYLTGAIDSKVSSPMKVMGDNTPIQTDPHPSFSLSSIQPIHGADLFRLSRHITQNVAYYLPRNTRLEEIGELLELECADSAPASSKMLDVTASNGDAIDGKRKGRDLEQVEVEEEWMGNKLKALTCYFGGLVTGQDDLF